MIKKYSDTEKAVSRHGVEYATCLAPCVKCASADYQQRYEERLHEMMNRTWTQSPLVEKIFAAVERDIVYNGGTGLLNWARGSEFSCAPGWNKHDAIGFLNPRWDRKVSPVGYKVEGVGSWELSPTREWDARWHRMPCDGIEKIMTCAGGSVHHFDDVPANSTDIASTIIVTSHPNMLDVLEMLGEIQLPKLATHEVFLVLGEFYLEHERPDIASMVEEGKKEGCVIDTRDWMREDAFQPFDAAHPRDCKLLWTGNIPEEHAEEVLASHLVRIMSYMRPFIDDSTGRPTSETMRQLPRALAGARALAIRDDFLRFPTVEAGGKVVTGGKWSRLMHAGYDFSQAVYPAPYDVLALEVAELESIAAIWKDELSRQGVNIIANTHDWDSQEKLSRAFAHVARRFGIDDSIDTLRAGVPVDDILA